MARPDDKADQDLGCDRPRHSGWRLAIEPDHPHVIFGSWRVAIPTQDKCRPEPRPGIGAAESEHAVAAAPPHSEEIGAANQIVDLIVGIRSHQSVGICIQDKRLAIKIDLTSSRGP